MLARVGVFNLKEIEELFPVRTFSLEGCGAKTDFNPGADAILGEPGLLHVV